jgi:LAO/AO transport system kinase
VTAEACTVDPAAVAARDRRAIARALSAVERGGAAAATLLAALPAGRRAYRIGVTGPPGAGKSTLTMQLIAALRGRGSVAVIAVDPSSPFSGGALLGDRVRMNDVADDPEVFIRSMASRGALGGLSAAVADGADVLDAAGFDWVIVETVGVGQSELEVVRVTDTTLVVVTPESGDEVQTAKAGLMEIADVFVLNKDDRPDGNAMWNALRRMVDARRRVVVDAWAPPIVRTVAAGGRGIDALVGAIGGHRAWLGEAGRLAERRRARGRERLSNLVAARFAAQLASGAWHARLESALDAIEDGRETLHAAAEALYANAVGRA